MVIGKNWKIESDSLNITLYKRNNVKATAMLDTQFRGCSEYQTFGLGFVVRAVAPIRVFFLYLC